MRTRHPLYQTWVSMRARCRDPGHPNFARYGGRGVVVCARWLSFEAFLSDVGPRPSPLHSIDRIDNDGNYEPGNVRWATAAEQNRNKRSTRLVTVNGRTMAASDWALAAGIDLRTLLSRLHRGWSPERAVFAPLVPFKDCAALGRAATAKLTFEQVREIRAAYVPRSRNSAHSQGALAKRFGVSQRAISNVVRGKAWVTENAVVAP